MLSLTGAVRARHHSGAIADQRRTALSRKRARAALLVAAVASAALTIPSSPAVASQIIGFSFSRPVDVTNTRSSLKIDVMWASSAPLQGLFLWPNNPSKSQEFDALDSGGGYFRLRARHSRQCLDLDGRGGYRNGTRVLQYSECGAGRRSAEWRVSYVGDQTTCTGDVCTSTSGIYPILRNRATNKCLDAANPNGRRPPQRAILQVWTCIRTAGDWNAGNQLFSVQNVR